jgi:hypothetical protein
MIMRQQIHVGGFNASMNLDERARYTGHRLVAADPIASRPVPVKRQVNRKGNAAAGCTWFAARPRWFSADSCLPAARRAS